MVLQPSSLVFSDHSGLTLRDDSNTISIDAEQIAIGDETLIGSLDELDRRVSEIEEARHGDSRLINQMMSFVQSLATGEIPIDSNTQNIIGNILREHMHLNS